MPATKLMTFYNNFDLKNTYWVLFMSLWDASEFKSNTNPLLISGNMAGLDHQTVLLIEASG